MIEVKTFNDRLRVTTPFENTYTYINNKFHYCGCISFKREYRIKIKRYKYLRLYNSITNISILTFYNVERY